MVLNGKQNDFGVRARLKHKVRSDHEFAQVG